MDFVTYQAPPQPIRSDKAITVHGGRIVPGALLLRSQVVFNSKRRAVYLTRIGLVVAVFPRPGSDMLEQVDVLWSHQAPEVTR